jgi:nucleoside-diphosphate-sugar epimerase
MRVLVTGGTGFIGGHVLRGLLKKGHEVVAFDAVPDAEWISDIADRVTIIKGEVQDLPSIADTIKKFETTHIIHTASLLTVASQQRPSLAFQVNIVGTVNILEAARLMDIPHVTYASSTAVYGYTEQGKVIDEEHPQKPATLYGVSKLLGEHYGSVYSQDYGMVFNALRFPIVYGPGQSRRGFSSIKEVVEKPVQGLPAKVREGGDQTYDTVYVKDVANAIISACFAGKTEHRFFNIGLGAMHSLRDVANIVSKVIPGAVLEIGPGFDIAEPVRGPLNIARARAELGYEPKFDLEKGVRDYIQTLRDHGRGVGGFASRPP